MPTVYYGTKEEPGSDLEQSGELIAVRTRSGRSFARSVGPVPPPSTAELQDATLVVTYPEAGVEVFRVPVGRGHPSLADRKQALKSAPDIRFAGGVLVDPASEEPVIYTENLFIKFKDYVNSEDCLAIVGGAGLSVKHQVDYATNAYFVTAPEGTGQKIFDIAVELLSRDDVEFCHPELIRPRVRKGIFPQQWHLKKAVVGGIVVDAHANVEAAHAITRGAGVTIAVIDDGVDIDHPEFGGAGKVVAPRDATLQIDDPRPKDSFGTGPIDGDNHGTACAGVACANGIEGASGVASNATLLPVRLSSGLGSQREADAFAWATDNGADVISCSWGPPDGPWWNPDHPQHGRVFPLPASTRLAIDYAIENGRNGKGCIIVFAAGNGNEPVDNDGYASNPKVIAVAACNDRGRRSVYSDYGNAVWCAFPSSDIGHPPFDHPDALTPGVWTTDRVGREGYNTGSDADGDAAGQYTNSFGGTSSACPGVAGVAALVLSVNPNLKWHEVRELLKRACDKIDPQGGDYGGSGHSQQYGYGRLNAHKAVELATPKPECKLTVTRTCNVPIPDLQVAEARLAVADDTPVTAVTATVDLKHSYIGDLVITLRPPASTGENAVMLRNRAGGSKRDMKKTYDAASTPALAKFGGKSCKGAWILTIEDKAARDAGTLISFSLDLEFDRASLDITAPNRDGISRVSRTRTTRHRPANRRSRSG